MQYGRLIDYEKNDNKVKICFEKQSVTIEMITDKIFNFFVPLYTSEHYSKAIESPKNVDTSFEVSFNENKKCVCISTDSYLIKIGDDFVTDIFDKGGNLVLSDFRGERKEKMKLSDKARAILHLEGHAANAAEEKKPVETVKAISKDTCFYGLGDKTGFLNKRNFQYIHWNSDIPQAHNEDYKALYKSIPFFIAKNKQAVYGLFFDNTFRSLMDMCKESEEYFVYEADGGNLDYYFIGGSTIKDIVKGYTYLTGTTPLPKLWTLGYMQCRWGYENEKDIRYIASTYRDLKIPCDSVQYDIDYMKDYRIFTWDEENYGKIGELFRDLKSNDGFKPVVIVDPGVKVDDKYFMSVEGHAKNYFAKDSVTGEDYINEVWPGESNYPDFGRKEVRDWWAEHLKEFVSYGIEGIWNDMNEPASFRGELPKDVIFHDEQRQIIHAEMHNIYGHFMSKATYEGFKAATGERPFVITRACYAGTQKYSTVWTGDNQSLWSHLQMMVPQLCNLGMSGFAIAGVDIGGFGADCNPELLARWIEAAFMSTFFRNHAAKGSLPQEPWRFGEEITNIYRKYVELHYKFIPYLYDLLKKCEDTGIPPMRPLVMEYEDDPETFNLNSEFMVGESMLIAPVMEQGSTMKAVYLPAGVWYDYWTGEKIDGGKWILRKAELDECPIYIKGGSIIPMYDVVQYVGEKEYDHLYLLVTPGEASYTHYHDNGIDFNYKNGEYNLYEFKQKEYGQIEINLSHKGYNDYAHITTVCLT